MPDVLDDLVTAGATIATAAENRPVALRCRRTTFERVLWNRAAAQQGVTLLCGHVDRIEHARGQAAGVTVDGRTLPAGVVIDASGRSSRFTDGLRPPAEGETAARSTSRGSIACSTVPTPAR
jgi:2-polyprenyl-6-methoxyphenol hydroxylase-like FAD-dependent oxidoreductase